MIKKFGLFFALTLVCFVSFAFGTTVHAEFNSNAADYGFYLEDESYTVGFYSYNTMNTYYHGTLVGSGTSLVGYARQRAQVNNKYRDVVLIRVQMEPADMYSSYRGAYLHGINNEAKMEMTLASGQTYVNYAPNSSLVTLTSSINFSVGGTAKSDGSFSGTLGVGASTGYTEDGMQIVSKIMNNETTYQTRYLYNWSAAFFGTAGDRARNLWCNSTHKAYAMYMFDDPVYKTNFTISYFVSFNWGSSSSAVWDGRTWTVNLLESCFTTTTRTITYIR